MKVFLDFFRATFPWVVMGLLLAIYFGARARKKEDKNSENYGLIGMCMGMCIGISLQGIVGSVGTAISLGMLAGLLIGSLIEDDAKYRDIYPEEFNSQNLLGILQTKNAYDIMPVGKERNKCLRQAKAPSTANTGGFLFVLLRYTNRG